MAHPIQSGLVLVVFAADSSPPGPLVQVFSAAATVSIVLGFSAYGWRLHVWDLTLDQLIAGRKASFVTQFLFIPATMLTKISILLSYLRLAPQNSWFRRLSRMCISPLW